MYMRTSQKIDENPNKWPDWGLTYPILTKSNKLWESNQTKEREFQALEAINCGMVNIWRKVMVDKGYLVRFV